ncbi:MAG: hypothetical protein ACT4QD_11880 [Acidobacteriota bacterium]
MPPARSCFAVCLGVALAAALISGQPRSRVAEDAREIRAFRLRDDHLPKLRQVAETLARGFTPAPERPRADAAMFVVLSMSVAFNEPFRDRTVAETVRTLESGHQDLRAAIRAAGLTTSEYVLAQIALLLSFPVVAGEKAGRAGIPPDDVLAENLAFVRRHWSEVEWIVKDLSAAAGQRQR